MNLYFKKEVYHILQQVAEISYEEVKPVFEFMNVHEVKKGAVLKDHFEVESRSRLMIRGYIGLFDCSLNRPVCRQIFVRGSIAWDCESYTTSELTKFCLISITDSIFVTIHKDDEPKILSLYPNLAFLAVKMNQLSNIYNANWKMYSDYPSETRIGMLTKDYPDLVKTLPDRLICDLLGLSRRTYYRLKNSVQENAASNLSD